MKFKYLFLILTIIILTGCHANYNLEITGDKFSEDIDIYIYEGDREADLHDGEESGDRISALIDRDVFTYFEDYSTTYDKRVEKKDDYTLVNLKKIYNVNDFKNTNSIRLCFENQKFDITDEYYDINLSGYFYCLYNNENITIKIKSNNKVVENNAEKIEGNEYYWTINKNNFTNVNIILKTEKVADNKIYIIIAVAIIIVAAVIAYLFIRKNNKRNDF